MIRTQIQLLESQAETLRQMSVARNQSIAELIRIGVDLLVKQEGGSNSADRLERARLASGRFASGSPDGSREHDRHLADAFGGA